MANAWQYLIAALPAIGHMLEQQRQQRQAETLAAAKLMQDRGQFLPVSPDEASAPSAWQRFVGAPAPGTIQFGQQAFRFSPYPMKDIPGVGQIPLTPDLAMKLYLQQLEQQGYGEMANQIFQRPDAQAPQPGPIASPSITEEAVEPPGMTRLTPEKVPPQLRSWIPMAQKYAKAYGVDPELVLGLIRGESAGDPRAIGPVTGQGWQARGLMQLGPGVIRDYQVKDPFNPDENIRAGTAYLADLLQEFKDLPTALVAYNWGPERVRTAGGRLLPSSRAFADQVMNFAKGMVSPRAAEAGTVQGPAGVDTALMREVGALDAEIARLEQVARSIAGKGPKGKELVGTVMQQITRLETRKQRLEDQLTEPGRAVRKAQALGPVELAQKRQETEMQAGVELAKQQQLTSIYADRARQEAEATEPVRARLAQAARELQPGAKEATDKVDALMTVKSAIAKIKDILARRGNDPEFAKGFKSLTGPLQGMVTQYFSQPFAGEDADENDFVTALRTLQTQEIRAQAGLAQTGTEVERAIGWSQGRLPVIFNPPKVFESRMRMIDESTTRSLRGQARNFAGREYGKFIQEYLDEEQRIRTEPAATPAAMPIPEALGRVETAVTQGKITTRQMALAALKQAGVDTSDPSVKAALDRLGLK